jgi:hypothetical protein
VRQAETMNYQQTDEGRPDQLLEFLILLTIDQRNPPDVRQEALLHIRDIELEKRMENSSEQECQECPFKSLPPYNHGREMTVQHHSTNYNTPLMLTNGTESVEAQYRH